MLNLLKKYGKSCKREKGREKITAAYFLYIMKKHPAFVWQYFCLLFSDVKICGAFPPPSDLHLLFSVDLSGSVFTSTPRDN